jgi:hypothetical protein
LIPARLRGTTRTLFPQARPGKVSATRLARRATSTEATERVVLVKESVIKAVCKGSSITLTPPFAGDIGIILSLGTTDRYCAQFGAMT